VAVEVEKKTEDSHGELLVGGKTGWDFYLGRRVGGKNQGNPKVKRVAAVPWRTVGRGADKKTY